MKISFAHVALATIAAANVATAGMLAWFLLAKPEVRTFGQAFIDHPVRVESSDWDRPVRVEIIRGKVSVDGTVAATVEGPVRMREPVIVTGNVNVTNESLPVEGTPRRGMPVRVQVAP